MKWCEKRSKIAKKKKTTDEHFLENKKSKIQAANGICDKMKIRKLKGNETKWKCGRFRNTCSSTKFGQKKKARSYPLPNLT